MKKLFIIALACIAIALPLYAGPATFEEFKTLEKSDQEALSNNLRDPTRIKYVIWRQRLGMGEVIWRQEQLRRVAEAKKYYDLLALFDECKLIKEKYSLQEGYRQKSSMTAADFAKETAKYPLAYQKIQDQNAEAIRLIAALADTEGARSLNKQANDLCVAWARQFPQGTAFEITPEQMAAIDQEVQTITTRLKNLATITSQELQAAIDRLPNDSLR